MTESIDFELGINTFLETSPDPVTGKRISHSERIRNGIEEIVVADQVGLDVFGIGEHQRFDFASEAPAVILAAAAALTKRIRLTSAVTVLSSDDPVRVYQSFSTLDSISNGRAEIMVGRGSFVDSFPLFGYSLNDYDELFEEHLELLLKIRASEKVTWRGGIARRFIISASIRELSKTRFRCGLAPADDQNRPYEQECWDCPSSLRSSAETRKDLLR